MNTKTAKILVTGGAGFIGSWLVDELLVRGNDVIIFDNLEPQVHGNNRQWPDYLQENKNLTKIKGDINNKHEIQRAMEDVDAIVHLAAAVGVAQSMYKIQKFTDTNSRGTGLLLDLIANDKKGNIKKIIIASSMSIYGEGAAKCPDCGVVYPEVRENLPKDLFNDSDWELKCPNCGKIVQPIPTKEDKPAQISTVYALTKKYQEDLTMLIGKTYGIDTTALRFFGVYGSRQALSNPYTGVCSIFATSLLSGNSPKVFENGKQTRDLVHVKDIVQGITLSLFKTEAKWEIFNVGTGNSITIEQVAKILRDAINPEIPIDITRKFRKGDVRHIVADISKIKDKLGYDPKFNFKQGIREVIEWIKTQKINNNNFSYSNSINKENIDNIIDKSNDAEKELEDKGLLL